MVVRWQLHALLSYVLIAGKEAAVADEDDSCDYRVDPSSCGLQGKMQNKRQPSLVGSSLGSETPSKQSSFVWQWGTPFQNAAKRPLDESQLLQPGLEEVFAHAVGSCVAFIRVPSKKILGQDGMTSVSALREALDIEMLSCLQGRQLTISPDLAALMLYQVVLVGLSRCCEWICQNIKTVDPLKSFSPEAMASMDNLTRQAVLDADNPLSQIAKWWGRTPYLKDRPTRPPLLFSMNAVQLALKVGDARSAKMLAQPNTVIHSSGRTLADYVQAAGSPIALDDPSMQAKRWSVEHEKPSGALSCDGVSVSRAHLGWSQATALEKHDYCDFDVVDILTREQYETMYRDTGRPVLVKNFVPAEERCVWAKHSITKNSTKYSYGPTAYPPMTGRKACQELFTVAESEKGLYCKENPGQSNYHVSDDPGPFIEITSTESYRKLKDIIVAIQTFSKQYFWGGDKSGAALHYHDTAFNFLWVGQKEWFLTPPTQAAVSGITSFQLWNRTGIDMERVFRCTQQAGDLLLVPEGWGHSTMCRGFCAGIGCLYHEDGASEHFKGLMLDSSPKKYHEQPG